MREINNGVDTVNEAANAIISAGSRVQQVTVPTQQAVKLNEAVFGYFKCYLEKRKRWAAFLSVYWCFGSQKKTKRVSQATLVPEPAPSSSPSQISNPTETRTLPFMAPPSSPASFLTSEPPSSAQSPGGFISRSPSPRPSIFTIGPYANETQLVSPPVFSAFTTEPSTAPFTPPPESLQLTTPSSPEVPFARLLSPSFDPGRKKSDLENEFSPYQWGPGSPIGHLISPSSVCSGTSSPLPYTDLHSRKHGSILDGQIPDVVPDGNGNTAKNRVSFELAAEEVARALESSFGEGEVADKGETECLAHETSRGEVESSGELNASGEFYFGNVDGVTVETVPPKNWAFFPDVKTEAAS